MTEYRVRNLGFGYRSITKWRRIFNVSLVTSILYMCL